MDLITIEAIQIVGFPIVAVLGIAGFMTFIVKWVLSKYDEQLREERVRRGADLELIKQMREDHRKDIKSLADKFSETVEKTSDKTNEAVGEHTKQLITLVERVNAVLINNNEESKNE
jgi:hypothetical protein